MQQQSSTSANLNDDLFRFAAVGPHDETALVGAIEYELAQLVAPDVGHGVMHVVRVGHHRYQARWIALEHVAKCRRFARLCPRSYRAEIRQEINSNKHRLNGIRGRLHPGGNKSNKHWCTVIIGYRILGTAKIFPYNQFSLTSD